jgi:hypothetical protein
MTTREALHQLVDELPDDKAELRAFGLRISATLPTKTVRHSTRTHLLLSTAGWLMSRQVA